MKDTSKLRVISRVTPTDAHMDVVHGITRCCKKGKYMQRVRLALIVFVLAIVRPHWAPHQYPCHPGDSRGRPAALGWDPSYGSPTH